jgi:hypothetical protein
MKHHIWYCEIYVYLMDCFPNFFLYIIASTSYQSLTASRQTIEWYRIICKLCTII